MTNQLSFGKSERFDWIVPVGIQVATSRFPGIRPTVDIEYVFAFDGERFELREWDRQKGSGHGMVDFQ
jgi:hypothetical protein